MSTNKNATIRYQALNQCFRNPGRNYYIEDLIEACNHSLLDIDPGSSGIKRRQIFDDIKFMRDSKGFNAPIESYRDGKRSFYRYADPSFSINNQPLNEREAHQLKESLITLSRFKGLPQFEWIEEMKARLEVSFRLKSQHKVIEFDENQYLTGREYLGILYDAIINRVVLEIEYHPFRLEEPMLMIFHPYFLKQFNNRWFLFGKNGKGNLVTTIALDRICAVRQVHEIFMPNSEINFEEYFEDIVGVSVPYDGILEKVVLKIEGESWPYIKTKPIHGSQKVKEQKSGYTIIELQVIPTFELEALILSYAEGIEVVSPQSLRLKIKERVNKLHTSYHD